MSSKKEVLLSDTNVLLKLILFPGLDLIAQNYPSFGLIKFHPFVQSEIADWKNTHTKKGKHRKIDKFSLPVIERALKTARTTVLEVSTPTQDQKSIAFTQYKSIRASITSYSADPTDNDLMLLYHAEMYDVYMVSNDDIIYKIGKRVIGDKSLEVEDLVIDLLIAKIITVEQVGEYSKILEAKNELFKLNKVLSSEVLKKIK